jgi:hypothetical protein
MSKIIFMMQKGCKPRAKCVASLAQSQSGSWRCMGSAGPTNQHGAAMPDVKRLTLPTLMWRLSIVGAPKVHPLAKSVAIIGQTKFLWFVCACMHAAILFIFGKQYCPFLDVSGCMHACMRVKTPDLHWKHWPGIERTQGPAGHDIDASLVIQCGYSHRGWSVGCGEVELFVLQVINSHWYFFMGNQEFRNTIRKKTACMHLHKNMHAWFDGVQMRMNICMNYIHAWGQHTACSPTILCSCGLAQLGLRLWSGSQVETRQPWI